METVTLRKGRDSSLLRKHPWVFSGAITQVTDTPGPGETVLLRDAGGKPLGLAAWSPSSQIRARVWTFDCDRQVDANFLAERMAASLRRRGIGERDQPGAAMRLVYGESDGLPGLVVDWYPPFLVCQFLSAGTEHWKEDIVAWLADRIRCRGIHERSDVGVRAHEGLPQSRGVLHGEAPPATLELLDRCPGQSDMRFLIDIPGGHKTGFYLDQAANRRIVGAMASGREVLNCFSYTGGFAVACLAAGARHVCNVDSSEPALALCERTLALNNLPADHYSNVAANVFELLRAYRKEGRQFDMLILDPPKFADTRSHLKKAARAYKDIAMQAAHLLRPSGLLVNFSCSAAIDLSLFQKITADALLDAGRNGQVIRYLHQHEDHPVALPFPESQYLKGLVCRLD